MTPAERAFQIDQHVTPGVSSNFVTPKGTGGGSHA